MSENKNKQRICNSCRTSNFKIFMKYFLLMCFGGVIYVSLELLFRQYSTIEMMYCAMFCALFIAIINNIFSYEMDFLLQCIICMLICTGFEWIFGILFNQDFHIWDYRNMPLVSPDYQVCVPFMLVWLLLAIICIPLLDYIEWKVFNYKPLTPPYYKIFNKKIFQFKN